MESPKNLQSSHSLDAFYENEDPWSYDSTPDDQRRLETLLAALPREKFNRTLDIGCGNGFITAHLPGRNVFGIDLSQRAIEWARIRAKRLDKRVDYRQGSIFEIDSVFVGGGFDLIVVTGVLYPQYIGKAFNLLSIKLDQLLADGGYLVLVHIHEWYKAGFPYKLIDRQIYPYREYDHLLEVYKK